MISMWDLLFPRRCPICDRAMYKERYICFRCEEEQQFLDGNTCFKCGKRLHDDEDIYCYDCRRHRHMYDRGFAVFEYEYICRSLYRFKYSHRAEYAAYYGEVTAKRLGKALKVHNIEAFVPVPIHRDRYIKRGYNQAEEYAMELSSRTGIPVVNDLIIREKKTKAQKKLNPSEREKNLKKAFKLNSDGVKLQRVCIVDDIYTTGSTIDAMAVLLKKAGVREVYFATIAIGKGL